MQYYVYIMATENNTTIYVGVTNNLIRRIYEHKNKVDKKSFTARYNVNKLVYYEVYKDSISAITREKQLKSGSRRKKDKLINDFNAEWKDLYSDIIG